jgi:DNA-directed RNA polymerase subunit omega
LEQLLAHVDSKYRLVVIAAKRAKQLMSGAEPLIAPRSHTPSYIALEELGAGTLTYEAEGALAREIVASEAKPTWFRSLSAEETLAEGAAIDEEEGEPEEADLEEAPHELLAEPTDLHETAETSDLNALEAPETPEEES